MFSSLLSSQENLAWLKTKNKYIVPSYMFYQILNNISNATYAGTTYLRGIPCDYWYQYINNYQSKFNSHDIVTNMTVLYYFMQKSYNKLYSQYSIPVRIHITGTWTIINSTTNQTYSFENYYDYANFVVGVPSRYWMSSPTNKTCDFASFCNNISSLNKMSDSTMNYTSYYSSLISLCTQSDINAIKIPSTYGNNYQVVEKTQTTKCSDIAHQAWYWILTIVIFFIGTTCGICYYLRNKTQVIHTSEDDAQL